MDDSIHKITINDVDFYMKEFLTPYKHWKEMRKTNNDFEALGFIGFNKEEASDTLVHNFE